MNLLHPSEIEIRSIFSPHGSFITRITDKSYLNIANDVNKGILSLSHTSIELDELNLPPRQGKESSTHRLLKANAAKLLRNKGETQISFEGFDFSDVYGDTIKIRVECGHTDGVRLYRSFWYVSEFWILKYPIKSISDLYKFKIKYDRVIELEPEALKIVPSNLLKQWIDESLIVKNS